MDLISQTSSALRTHLATTRERSRAMLDRAVPPSKRAEIHGQLSAVVAENPLLSTFLITQAMFAILPLTVFIAAVLSSLVLALLFATLVLCTGMFLFIATVIGLGLAVLIPTLIGTIFVAAGVWIAGVVVLMTWRVWTRLMAERSGSGDAYPRKKSVAFAQEVESVEKVGSEAKMSGFGDEKVNGMVGKRLGHRRDGSDAWLDDEADVEEAKPVATI